MNCLKAKNIKKGSRVFCKSLGVHGILHKKIPFESRVKMSLKSKCNQGDLIIVDIEDVESSDFIDSLMYGNADLINMQSCINQKKSLEDISILENIIQCAHGYHFDMGRISCTLKVSPEICFLKMTGYIEFSEEDYEALKKCFSIQFRQVVPAV